MNNRISSELFDEISKYIKDRYVDQDILFNDVGICSLPLEEKCLQIDEDVKVCEMPDFLKYRRKISEYDLEQQLEKSFSEELLFIIERRNLKTSDVYRKANIDRKHFSKIKNNPDYRPSKITAIAFALAFELDLDETDDFIGKAGYKLTHSSRFDIIIEYCIENKIYDVLEVNDILYDFGENLIGC